LQYSKEELRRMGWRGETYFSRSQNGRAAPYIDDMDSDSDYEYDDLSRVPEHLLSKSWDDPSILQTYAPTAGASAAPPPQRVTPPPSSVSANGSDRRHRDDKEEEKEEQDCDTINRDTINDKDGLVF
jgi:hypothetical protein